MNRLSLAFALAMAALFSLSSCGGHALDGHWHQHLAGGGKGLEFEFNPDNDKVNVHGAPRADGGHAHYAGTYRLEGQQLSIRWQQDGAAIELAGTLDGDRLVMTGPEGEVEFERGSAGDEHH